jgi:hypothetical protein
MRSTSITATATGATSDIVILDQYTGTFDVGLFLTSTGNTTQGTVQITGDDPFLVSSPTWINATLSTTGNNKAGNLSFPAKAVRLNVTSYGVPLKLTVVQQGILL